MDHRTLPPHATDAVDAAITTRRSIRAFLPEPVPRETVARIMEVAARAPSGSNTQPWQVHVLTGAARQRLCAAVEHAFLTGPEEGREYDYYPDPFFEPYLGRRRQVGWALYGLLGIGKRDTDRTKRQHARNFRFFDAPVGMILTLDRRLNTGSYMDTAMFLQNVCIAARARGLDTCAQAAWATFPKTVRGVLGLDENRMVVCGVALGLADPDAPENRLIAPRTPVSEFAVFLDR